MKTPQQTRELYKKLPQKMRAVIASPELIEIIKSIAVDNKLDEDEQDKLSKYIVDLLVDSNNKNNFSDNITADMGFDETLGQKISAEIEAKILNNLDNLYTEIVQNTEIENKEVGEGLREYSEENTVETKDVEKFSPNSYEQILINQAKAMRPVGIAPSNLPTEEASGVEERAIHHSIGYTNSDPYREPTE